MTVRNPQLFHSASVADLDKYIEDDAWALEQKVDGMRCLTVISRNLFNQPVVEFFTRGGRPLKSSAAKLHFDRITEELLKAAENILEAGYKTFEIVLDAELVTETGTLVLLDMPYLRYNRDDVRVNRTVQYSKRRSELLSFFAVTLTEADSVTVVRGENSLDDKIGLVNSVIEKNLEGFIAKRLDSPYAEGVRVKHSLKIKLTQTADVIVLAKNSGESRHSKRGGDKINYEFGVYRVGEDGSTDLSALLHIGNCSGIGKAYAQVGDVIEVEYLYAGAGGKLVQPRMVQIREDKRPEECTADQLKFVNKELL